MFERGEEDAGGCSAAQITGGAVVASSHNVTDGSLFFRNSCASCVAGLCSTPLLNPFSHSPTPGGGGGLHLAERR